MKYYLVKVVGIATPENPGYAGETSICFYGRGQQQVYRGGTHLPYLNTASSTYGFGLVDYLVEEYGYRRKCDAKRSWFYTSFEDTKYWHYEKSIIEFDPEVDVQKLEEGYYEG